MAGNTYERRVVILYSIPWIVFSLINATLAVNISSYISQQVSSYFYLSLLVLQLIAGVFGALIGGVIADFFGRRLPLAFSLTLYGIGSALAGLTQNYAVYYFVYIASGLSWGILLTMYSFVVWGDLANEKNYFKMYAIGLIIFFSATGVGLLTQLFQIPLIVSSLATCMLIFISNIPVILAPELLPSGFLEKIKLKLHMTAIRKISEQSQNQG
jgi:MFS family permease